MVDKIQDLAGPPSIVLRHRDSDTCDRVRQEATNTLTRPEIKQVAKCLLQALRRHFAGIPVITPFTSLTLWVPLRIVKRDNVFINHGHGRRRFSEIRLGVCGGVDPQGAPAFAREGLSGRFAISPEAMFRFPWGTLTNVW